MPLPKKIKKNISLIEKKTLLPRRHEIADMISQDGTYLPKSLLHPDLDRGFLDFVRDELKCVVEGKTIPMVDILVTTQNWSQFTETWDFQNIDKNVDPPFIAVVRSPIIHQLQHILSLIEDNNFMLRCKLGTDKGTEWIFIKFHNQFLLI